ncbi:unnamed protein product, partial [Dovyalis caffra]
TCVMRFMRARRERKKHEVRRRRNLEVEKELRRSSGRDSWDLGGIFGRDSLDVDVTA